MKILTYFSSYNTSLLPSLTIGRYRSTSYSTERKELEDGWVATRRQAGSEEENDEIRLTFTWIRAHISFIWDMT